jgi:hypothetical protein
MSERFEVNVTFAGGLPFGVRAERRIVTTGVPLAT